MYVVVDVNVVLSSLLFKGNSFSIFSLNSLSNKFDFIAPEFLSIELNKHKKEIMERTKMPEKEFEENFDFILSQINLIPDSDFNDKIIDAKKILGIHEKDVPYLALSLKLNCTIFSGDKKFKELCPDKVLNPREMIDKFFS